MSTSFNTYRAADALLQERLADVSPICLFTNGLWNLKDDSPVFCLFVDDADQDMFTASSKLLPTRVSAHQSEVSPLALRTLQQTCDQEERNITL